MFAPLGSTNHKIHIKTIIFKQRSRAAQVCEALEGKEKRKDVHTDRCDHVTSAMKSRQRRAPWRVCFTLTIPAGGLVEPVIRNHVIIHLTRSLLSYSFKHVTKHGLFFFFDKSRIC